MKARSPGKDERLCGSGLPTPPFLVPVPAARAG